MSSLVLHPSSKALLQNLTSYPPHGLLLQGPVGVGLMTIARNVSSDLTDTAHVVEVLPDDGTISIETVRGLYDQARVKHERLTVVIIDDADTMGTEAQNALLKLLEEPTSNLMFILTSHAPQMLLPTVLSRVETIDIKPVSSAASKLLLDSLGDMDEMKYRQILFLAQGLPAEIHRYVGDEAYFSNSAQLARDARQLITDSKTDMLAIASKYTNRTQAVLLLSLVGKLMVHTLYRSHDKRIATRLALIDDTLSHVHANGNVKLQMYRLVSKW